MPINNFMFVITSNEYWVSVTTQNITSTFEGYVDTVQRRGDKQKDLKQCSDIEKNTNLYS